MKLSLQQKDFLAVPFYWTRQTHNGEALCFPRSGQHRTAQSLCRKGLMEFVDYGRDITGESDFDVPLYGPTEEGTRLLFTLGMIDGHELVPGIQAGLRVLCSIEQKAVASGDRRG